MVTQILSILCVASMVILIAQYLCVVRKVREKLPATDLRPGISVLKPVKGMEDGLYENLVAAASQDYPNYELIIGAEDACDPALVVARRVQNEFPHLPIRVEVVSRYSGLNPKVRVLRELCELAQHELILVSDSNVRPDAGYMTALVATRQKYGGHLVHNVLLGEDGSTLGARLEALHMNGWVAGAIAICDAARHPIVIGKSMLTAKSDLSRAGGFESVADVLAEDYVLGTAYRHLGMRVALCPFPLQVITGERPLSTFLNRHIRWGQLRRNITPHYFVGELLANPTPFLLAAWAAGGLATGRNLLPVLLLKWLLDAALCLWLAPRTELKTLACLPLKDLLVPWMWAVSAVRRRVNWRGHRMLIGAGSRLSPADPGLQPLERSA